MKNVSFILQKKTIQTFWPTQYTDHKWSCILLVTSHNTVTSDWLILSTRNPYIQVKAPDFLKSHFEAKRVGNYYYYFL